VVELAAGQLDQGVGAALAGGAAVVVAGGGGQWLQRGQQQRAAFGVQRAVEGEDAAEGLAG
jgi:hypothetical protein